MLSVLDQYEGTPGFERLIAMTRKMMSDLVVRSAGNSLMELTGATDTRWSDLFASGKNVVYEHFPDVYLAWLSSTEDGEELFRHPAGYLQIAWTGEMEGRVYELDEAG